MSTIEFTYHLDHVNTAAQWILNHAESKVLAFKGDMGSGKTTLIKALLEAMKSEDVSTSPSFSIVNEYRIPDDKVYHFDLYRINNIEEAYDFGIEEYVMSPNWVFIEWPDIIEDLLPRQTQAISIEIEEHNRRTLKLTINNKLITEDNAMTGQKF